MHIHSLLDVFHPVTCACGLECRLTQAEKFGKNSMQGWNYVLCACVYFPAVEDCEGLEGEGYKNNKIVEKIAVILINQHST